MKTGESVASRALFSDVVDVYTKKTIEIPMDAINKCTIEMKQMGAAGWAFYVGQTRLPFSWEILGTEGIGIFVPKAGEWDAFCEKHNADWAKGNRDEILTRLANGVINKRYGRGSFELNPTTILIKPGPSLMSFLLSFLR